VGVWGLVGGVGGVVVCWEGEGVRAGGFAWVFGWCGGRGGRGCFWGRGVVCWLVGGGVGGGVVVGGWVGLGWGGGGCLGGGGVALF